VPIQKLGIFDGFIGRQMISRGFNDTFLDRLCSNPPDRPDFGLPSTQQG
jgi:hypothetical protein